MLPCTLYIVRHGQSEANRDNLCGGQSDSPLTELGISQANEAKQLLSSVKFDAVYSSDLQRAARTAEIIWGSPVPDDHQLLDLRERSFGELEGQSDDKWKALSKQFDEMYGSLPLEQRWQHSYADFIEGNAPLVKRFTASLQSIAQSHQGETVLIGTHGLGHSLIQRIL
jgi:broad specificity phosphatase PhoE